MKQIIEIIINEKIIIPLVIIFVSVLCYYLFVKVIKKIFKFRSEKINVKKQKTLMTFFSNIIKYIIIIIGSLMILDIYGIDTKAIIASLGVASFVLGLAFQDLVKDFISGIAIVMDNTYNVGDWVTINGFLGEVTALGMKTTHLKAEDGRVLIINNGSISNVINHSLVNNKIYFDISVSHEEKVLEFEKLLTKLCLKLKPEIKNITSNIEFMGIEKVTDTSVVFRIMVDVKPLTQKQVQREFNKLMLLNFKENNIKANISVVNNG